MDSIPKQKTSNKSKTGPLVNKNLHLLDSVRMAMYVSWQGYGHKPSKNSIITFTHLQTNKAKSKKQSGWLHHHLYL